jgi:hypothetical protein
MLLIYAWTIPFGLISLHFRNRLNEFPIVLWAAIVTSMFFFVLVLLVHGMRRALDKTASSQAVLWAVGCGVISYLVVLALEPVLSWCVAGTFFVDTTHIVSRCLLALFLPAAVLAFAKGLADEIGYQEEWADLEIGE